MDGTDRSPGALAGAARRFVIVVILLCVSAASIGCEARADRRGGAEEAVIGRGETERTPVRLDVSMAELPVDSSLASPFDPPSSRRARIAATGDIMLQRRINRSAAQQSRGEPNNHGYDELFPGLSDVFSGVDVATGNMEFPVFEELRSERSCVFNGPRAAARALLRAGFSVVNGANNHGYDHGPESPASTARICSEEGLVCLGVGPDRASAEAPHYAEVNGLRLAFIGYTLLANVNLNSSDPARPRVNGYDFDGLLEQVRSAAARVDGVVVHLHWGAEYRTRVLSWQPGQAKRLIDAGAVLVFGHHPHVLGKVESVQADDGRLGLVAYSLGNFIANQGGSRPNRITRLGAIITADLELSETGATVVSWDAKTTWVENRDVRVDGRRIEDVHVVVVDERIAELREEIENTDDERERAALEREVRFFEGRVAAAEKIMENPGGLLPVANRGAEPEALQAELSKPQ